MPDLIPGLNDVVTVGLFGVGTTIFVFAMAMFYKGLKKKKTGQKLET